MATNPLEQFDGQPDETTTFDPKNVKKKKLTGKERFEADLQKAVEEKRAKDLEEEKRQATPEKVVKDVRAEREKVEAQDRDIARGDVRDVESDVETEFRDVQSRLAQALEAQSRGRGPSLAQGQLKVASDRALSQQLALAAQSRTPAQGALAQRLASRQAGEQQQALAGQSGLLRLQEQMQAQQLLAGVSGTARGQDVQTGALSLEAALANQGVDLGVATSNQSAAAVQQQQLNDLLGIQGNVATGIAGNVQGAANLSSQLAANRAAERSAANRARNAAIFSAAGTGIGAAFGGPAGAAVGGAAGGAIGGAV